MDVVIGSRLPPRVAATSRVISCVRPLVTPEQSRVLEGLAASSVRLVADFDDLLFDEGVGLPDSVYGGLTERARAERLACYASSLRSFHAFTVSTRALARRLARRVPDQPVTVIPNGLSEAWVSQGNELYRKFQRDDRKVIRYFAGSPSHDRDFATIVPQLAAFLAQHPEVRLEVVGPVRFNAGEFPPGTVAAVPSVEYDILPELLASTWVNLAPLEPTPFNDCKSALKVLESGAFDCPTLASPSDDVLRHVELGAPAIVCRSGHDWYEALVSLLDADVRARYGKGMADHVQRHGMARCSFPEWLTALGIEGSA